MTARRPAALLRLLLDGHGGAPSVSASDAKLLSRVEPGLAHTAADEKVEPAQEPSGPSPAAAPHAAPGTPPNSSSSSSLARESGEAKCCLSPYSCEWLGHLSGCPHDGFIRAASALGLVPIDPGLA